jgi:RNA polymerase sigma factor (sigma-70 family)
MNDDATVGELVHAAANGDQQAWNSVVDRYTPLVMSVTFRYRMSPEDAADVAQTLWLRLVQHLGNLRDPEALPGWILTTTRNECFRLLRSRQLVEPYDPQVNPPSERVTADRRGDATDLDEELLRNERHDALLAAFAELPDHQRELLRLMLTDPPTPYADISRLLGIPIGGIGPTRARAVERMRRNPVLAALMEANPLPAARVAREPHNRKPQARELTGGIRHGIAPVR